MLHVIDFKRPDRSLIDAFAGIGAATVHEASGQKGYIDRAIKPIAAGMKICGCAFTVQCAPGDNLMLHKALQRARAGDVLVAGVGGAFDFGYWGALMAASAKAKGLAGLAIDGCVRDAAEISEMGFPVFSRGLCVRGTAKAVLGLVNYPLNFGLATINPGDIILGDEDGMVVIRQDEARAVLEKSLKRLENEKTKAAQLRSGVSSVELNKLDKVFAELGLKEE